MQETSEIECTELLEVSSEKNGAKIVFATDDFFGVAENLLKEEEPVWKENEYTNFGKWMDGWETRRKRKTGNDYVIIALAAEAQVSHVCIDTCFFTGNFPPKFSISGDKLSTDVWCQNRTCILGGEASEDDYERISAFHSENWPVLIPKQRLDAGYPDMRKKLFRVSTSRTFTHLRLDIFPDGGIARLRVYGVLKQAIRSIGKMDASNDAFVTSTTSLEFDLVSRINDGGCVDYSNAHYGHPNNIIKPGKATSMADGWETARRHDRSLIVEVTAADPQVCKIMPGREWAIFKLGHAGDVKFTNIVIDTAYFKGNSPYSVKVEGGYASASNSIPSRWKVIMPFRRIRPNYENEFSVEREWDHVSHIKVTITPDGGLSRLRIFGRLRRFQSDILTDISD
ncbi:PREDICTED: probable allantoicase [Dinoponera quadriceps]|uniref:Allantoate amidinohydrolase n=1 Tax=Dinoponera quadriceps TaxID=609295 RepID=A0A6P3WTV7_DINQU|nr:PREDICTED: probable allantoicase [Dinoponera quadriceps]